MGQVSDSVIEAVRAHLVTEIGDENPSSASVTFLGLESLDVLRFGADSDVVRYVSLGCSRHPMADPNELVADPSRGPRAELVLTLRGGAGVASGVRISGKGAAWGTPAAARGVASNVHISGKGLAAAAE